MIETKKNFGKYLTRFPPKNKTDPIQPAPPNLLSTIKKLPIWIHSIPPISNEKGPLKLHYFDQ